MAEHNTLTGSSVHEEKYISSAGTSDAGKVVTPSSSTAGQGELRKLVVTELDTTTDAEFTTYEADGTGGLRAATTVGFRYGSVKINGSTTATTVSSSATWTAANTTDMVTGGTSGVTYSSGTLQIDSAGVYYIALDVSFSGATSNENYIFGISTDGGSTFLTPPVQRKVGTGGDFGSCGMHYVATLSASNVLAVYLQNLDSTANPTVKYMTLSCVQLQQT